MTVLDLTHGPLRGPTLDLNAQVHGPSLMLGQQQQGPQLTLEPMAVSSADPSSNAFAITSFVVAGVLALAVILPMSRMNAIADDDEAAWYQGLMSQVMALFGQEEPAIEVDTADEAEAAENEGASNVDVMAHLQSLKGMYCFNFMPGGDQAAAVAAFDALIWSKLSPDWQSKALERLDVCMPFELASPDVMTSGGCAKSMCGTEDVHFYVNNQGKAAVDMNIAGRCSYITEEGFTQLSVLCSH